MGDALAAEPVKKATEEISAGTTLEVVILTGTHKSCWVRCSVSKLNADGTIDIHVLPTTEYGRAAGASDTDVPAVSRNHLRRLGAVVPLGPPRADANPEWIV